MLNGENSMLTTTVVKTTPSPSCFLVLSINLGLPVSFLDLILDRSGIVIAFCYRDNSIPWVYSMNFDKFWDRSIQFI